MSRRSIINFFEVGKLYSYINEGPVGYRGNGVYAITTGQVCMCVGFTKNERAIFLTGNGEISSVHPDSPAGQVPWCFFKEVGAR